MKKKSSMDLFSHENIASVLETEIKIIKVSHEELNSI